VSPEREKMHAPEISRQKGDSYRIAFSDIFNPSRIIEKKLAARL
jgi:hypothetical protein